MTAIAYLSRSLLRLRWRSTLGVMVIVAVTGGVTLALVAGAVRTLTAPDRYVDASGLTVDAGIEQFDGLPRTAEIRELPAVSSAESVTFMFGALLPGTATEGAGGAVDLFNTLDGLTFAGSPDAVGALLAEGRAVDPNQIGEFVASRSFAQAAGAGVGDTFVLVTVSKDQAAASGFDVAEPAGPRIPATLVGIFEGSASLQDDFPLAVFAPSILDGADIAVSATQVAVDLAPGATIDDLRAQLDSLPRGDQFGLQRLEIVPDAVRRAVTTQGIGLLVLAVIVGAATVVVAGQTIGREVRLPETQRSALRTLGMTQEQLGGEALVRASIPVAGGVALAAVVAVVVSDIFPYGFARQVEPASGIRFDPLVHLLGAVGLAGVLLAWLGFGLTRRRRSAARTAPAMSERLASSLRPTQAATALRFTFMRNQRDTGSPRAQTAGLIMVLVVAAGALTFGANVSRLVDEPSRYGSPGLGLGAGGGEIPQEVRDRLAADTDVAALTMFAASTVSAGSISFDIGGVLPVVGEFEPTVLDGRLPTADDEIALGSVLARRLGVGVDDDVDIAGAAGRLTLRVTGLAVIPGIEGADGLGEDGLMSLDGLRTIDPEAPVSAGMLHLRSGAPPDTAERLSGLVGMGIGPFDPPGEIINLARVRSLPFVLVAVLGLLAVLSLAHQLIQSAQQRRRDMAILRALGADRGWVSAVVHWQATMLTLLVFVVALPIGFIVGRATYRQVADRIGAQTDVFLPALWLVVVLAVLIVFANLAAAVPSRRVRRLPPAGFLNQE